MVSVDFRHQLNWDPGPGTPPGARYNVSTRKLSDNHTRWKVYKKTSCLLKLDNLSRYSVSVHAFYNLSLVSPESMAIVFSPYKDTNISAPWLSLVGGDHHLKLNISLARAKKINIQALYGSIYRIYWKKAGGRKDTFIDTENSSVVLGNLEVGVEYCVQVHIMNRVNPNTQPSRWMCASTSDPEPSKVPTVLGITVPILVLVVGGMALFMVILHYIGYLCKIKDRLPDILLDARGDSSGNYCTRTNPSVDRVVLVGKVPLPGSHGQPEQPGITEWYAFRHSSRASGSQPGPRAVTRWRGWHPLVCNLTGAFTNPTHVYYTMVVAILRSQASPGALQQDGFKPIKDSELGAPELTVAPCNQSLVVLRDLAPGQEYCVSVSISDSEVPRKSAFSPPQCTSTTLTTTVRTEDVAMSVAFCSVAVLLLAVVFLLKRTGVVGLKNRLPRNLVCPSPSHPAGHLVTFSPEGRRSELHSETCAYTTRHVNPLSPTREMEAEAEVRVGPWEGCDQVDLLSLTFGEHGEGWPYMASHPPAAHPEEEKQEDAAMDTVASEEETEEPGGYLSH
ncbi:hypothetical protein NHX12_006732 [Muraenolepis orangiensis]|uniref:Interferon/interleukin receptor domain-containing protein n=1 Tax=Muraenolepis orangiensis TaxID=630683 RepID=A0A9Q0DNI1_9TELE|nr:hypothetical protein NHX12_006732 [Muraenolepis orangiensis]